jgi:glucose/arabinose dehydrogenase
MGRRALLAAASLSVIGAGAAALSIEASPRRAGVTAVDCRGTTGQRTTILRNGLRRAKAPLFRLRRVARGLVEPVYVATTPSQPARLYVVEKRGRVRVLEHGRLLGAPFADLRSSVRHRGEEGLLSLAFHPRYRENQLVYVAFDDRQGDVNLVEYRTDGRRILPPTARPILLVDKLEGVTWHNGGQLQFGPDGKLYFSTGDSAHTPLDDVPTPITDPNNQAQDPGTLFGKLFRIDVDSVQATVQLVAYGLRNPWRFSFDSATGSLYIGDVGFHLWEEVDVLRDPRSGLYNFAWSACEGNAPFFDLDAAPADRRPRSLLGSGIVLPPLIAYEHPRAGYCTARGTVIGGYVYRGRNIPRLRGRYVFGDFCTGEIWSASISPRRASRIRSERRTGRLSSFGVGARGELFATTLGGSVFRLDPPP